VTLHGSCLCGEIAWKVTGDLQFLAHCHCSMCRKSHGAAFVTWGGGNAADLRLTRGEGRAVPYRASPALLRPFCPTCGSKVPNVHADGDQFGLAVGNLSDDPGIRPAAHIFAASRAPWYEIPDDGLPRFDEYPPGFASPAVAPRAEPEPAGAPGLLRGSCLCGGVAFEVAPLRVLVYCHCSRCRRLRGAAHNANGFAPADGFRITRGEDLIVTWKLPGAERFRSCFCRVCGSGAPRLRPGEEQVAVPAGALDDDPGDVQRLHIYTGSRAPWFEIHDDLPSFAEGPPRSG
jgi:hypothetical protein